MENLGALSILIAFCLAVFAVAASLAGKYGKRPFLIVSAERAVYSIWVLLTIASGLLIYSLLSGDFRLAYVAAHSNKAMPQVYKFTAWWGGQEGSLLLWAWLLSTYSAIATFTNRRKFREMMPLVTAIMNTVLAFFHRHDHICVESVPGVDGGAWRGECGRWERIESVAAVVDDGDSSAFSLSRICGIYGAFRFRDGIVVDQATG